MEVRFRKIISRVDPASDIFNDPKYLSVDIPFNEVWLNVEDVIHYYSGESLKDALVSKQGFPIKASERGLDRKYYLHFYDRRQTEVIIIPDRAPRVTGIFPLDNEVGVFVSVVDNRISITLEPADGFDRDGNRIELDGTGQYL